MKERRRVLVPMVLVLALIAISFGCASSLKTLNKARDYYNSASVTAQAAHNAGLVDDKRWDNVVQPALKQFHDAVHNGYKALEDGVEFNASQLFPGKDPANPTLYDIVKKYIDEIKAAQAAAKK